MKARSDGASSAYVAALATLGDNLLRQGKWADAEAVLRECLPIWKRHEPDAWTTSHTRSAIGGALLAQQKPAEAGPLLLKGYEGMKRREQAIPPMAKNQQLGDAVDLLIDLYTVTNKPEEVKKGRAGEAASKPYACEVGPASWHEGRAEAAGPWRGRLSRAFGRAIRLEAAGGTRVALLRRSACGARTQPASAEEVGRVGGRPARVADPARAVRGRRLADVQRQVGARGDPSRPKEG